MKDEQLAMNKKVVYYPEGTCSQMIGVELEGDVIKEVVFIGGCNGNLSGISKLITGMKAERCLRKSSQGSFWRVKNTCFAPGKTTDCKHGGRNEQSRQS